MQAVSKGIRSVEDARAYIEKLEPFEAIQKDIMEDAKPFFKALQRFFSGEAHLKELMKPGQAQIFDLAEINIETLELIVYFACYEILKSRLSGKIPPTIIIFDSAHIFASDAIVHEQNIKLRNLMREIMRRGRRHGLGTCLVSQRIFELDSNLLSQCKILLLLRTVNPKDLSGLTSGSSLIPLGITESLPRLTTGEAYLITPMSPPSKIRVRPRKTSTMTFDLGLLKELKQRRASRKYTLPTKTKRNTLPQETQAFRRIKELLAELLAANGFYVKQESEVKAIRCDLLATDNQGTKVVVEVKGERAPINIDVVDQVRRNVEAINADGGIIGTVSEPSERAQSTAARNRIKILVVPSHLILNAHRKSKLKEAAGSLSLSNHVKMLRMRRRLPYTERRILDEASIKEVNATELKDDLGLDRSTISRYLNEMSKQGLLKRRKEGRKTFFSSSLLRNIRGDSTA